MQILHIASTAPAPPFLEPRHLRPPFSPMPKKSVRRLVIIATRADKQKGGCFHVFKLTILLKTCYSPCPAPCWTFCFHPHRPAPDQQFFFLFKSSWNGKLTHLIIHAVHDGHELLQSGLTLLFTTFGHKILTEPGNHAHDLRERAHLHHIGELLVPAQGTIV